MSRRRPPAITYGRGVCPRCGQVERFSVVDGYAGMVPHMLPGQGALIECPGTGAEPRR